MRLAVSMPGCLQALAGMGTGMLSQALVLVLACNVCAIFSMAAIDTGAMRRQCAMAAYGSS